MTRRISIGLLLLFAARIFAADPPPADAPANAPAPPNPAPDCKFFSFKLANPSDYYPSNERKAGHTGRVLVEFLPTESGKLVDLEIIKPSGYPALDAAALRVIENTRLKSNCPGKRFTWAVQFGPPT